MNTVAQPAEENSATLKSADSKENQMLRAQIKSREFQRLKRHLHMSVLKTPAETERLRKEIEAIVPRSNPLPAAVELWEELDSWLTEKTSASNLSPSEPFMARTIFDTAFLGARVREPRKQH